MSRPRAYQLMDAATVMDRMSTIVDKPESEAQARPLTKLPPEKQVEVWEEVVEAAIKMLEFSAQRFIIMASPESAETPSGL